MKIGIDVDSTLNTLGEEWAAWIKNSKLDPEFTFDQWTDWDIEKVAKGGDRLYDFWEIPGVFMDLGIQPGAVDATIELAKYHTIFIVTSTPARHWFDKAWWLEKNFPHIPPKNFIVTSHKGLLDLDMLIDDGPHNFIGFKGTSVTYHRPWNAKVFSEAAEMKWRVKEWKHVPSLVEHCFGKFKQNKPSLAPDYLSANANPKAA